MMNLRNLPGIFFIRLPLALAFCLSALVALAVSLPVLLLDPVIRFFCLRRPGRRDVLTPNL